MPNIAKTYMNGHSLSLSANQIICTIERDSNSLSATATSLWRTTQVDGVSTLDVGSVAGPTARGFVALAEPSVVVASRAVSPTVTHDASQAASQSVSQSRNGVSARWLCVRLKFQQPERTPAQNIGLSTSVRITRSPFQ